MFLVGFVGIFLSFDSTTKAKNIERRMERRVLVCCAAITHTSKNAFSTYENEQNDKNSRINMTGNAFHS